MRRQVYRYSFNRNVSMREVRDTLRLAVLASQSVFGHQRVLLEADFDLEEADRACWIDASNEVGRHLHQVFRGYVCREFGSHAFTACKANPAAHLPEMAVSS